jgi:hypothetical protein
VHDFGIIDDSMKTNLPLILILITFLYSCSKEKIEIDPDNPLIGVWNYSGYTDHAQVFARSKEFSDNPGYQFNADGTLMERKNAGFCGTPPVSYADYQGTWSIINDTLVRIDVGYWGGTTVYNLDIESVDYDFLNVIPVSADK